MHNRQDGGDGVLGKQLLASENDDHKTKGITKIFQQEAAGKFAQVDMEDAFGDQRGAHRKSGGNR